MEQKDLADEKMALSARGQMGKLLLRAARDFSELVGMQLKARGHLGLRLRHADLIANLDFEGTRITTLAERAGMTKQSMGPLVRELEQCGYLQCSTDTSDRRAVLVRLSPEGEQLLRDVQESIHEIEARYDQVVGETEMQRLRYSLATLVLDVEKKNSL